MIIVSLTGKVKYSNPLVRQDPDVLGVFPYDFITMEKPERARRSGFSGLGTITIFLNGTPDRWSLQWAWATEWEDPLSWSDLHDDCNTSSPAPPLPQDNLFVSQYHIYAYNLKSMRNCGAGEQKWGYLLYRSSPILILDDLKNSFIRA